MAKSKTTPQQEQQLSSELARLIVAEVRTAFTAYSAALKAVTDGNTNNLRATARDLIELIELERAQREKADARLHEQMNALKELHGLEQQRENLLQ
ncbi:hypothetical protein [Phyllobacterium zundukense]|uniref:Uncharacterized protein n=1 Tax=Phyllobacterium zundukense TaxID=1867719 RepID=A0ACD4D519_9HYPH|nr:hypothetical protein [Phyllobacterium zundukense]UXN60905.1 hypothetical protein N8E88_31375 [Phyllobacterium zundukense]